MAFLTFKTGVAVTSTATIITELHSRKKLNDNTCMELVRIEIKEIPKHNAY